MMHFAVLASVYFHSSHGFDIRTLAQLSDCLVRVGSAKR